jgi:hypothetical protein
VCVVRDALGHWSASDAEQSLRQMEAKGATVTTTADVLNGTVGKVELPVLGRAARLPDAGRIRRRSPRVA